MSGHTVGRGERKGRKEGGREEGSEGGRKPGRLTWSDTRCEAWLTAAGLRIQSDEKASSREGVNELLGPCGNEVSIRRAGTGMWLLGLAEGGKAI